ncbi:MAG: pyk [Gammaproteobacteria bacterium]|nr:pyk [Gammaproteobacteria bacterium]
MNLRRTKIVATLGPSTDDPAMLERIFEAGVNVVRINFSHGADKVQSRIDAVRACAAKLSLTIGILADLQGPKIRIARFIEGSITLVPGAQFILDAGLDADMGTEEMVGIDYKELVDDVAFGDILLLDDGRIVLTVQEVTAPRIICRVEVGGPLSNHKGINRLGGGLSAEAFTEKDQRDMKVAVAAGVDYIAISFPRDAADMQYAREMLESMNGKAGLIAKIERAEAIEHIDEIINASDGVMVARGDLAVEIGAAQVPGAQKEIIRRARALDKPVITATQMMESMIENTIPTRAEVSDVANAVLDLTDAVMLSAESAIGAHPDKVVDTMSRICIAAERERETQISGHRMEMRFARIDEAIAMAALYTANHLSIKAVITLTESGATPLMMSRIKTSIPIYGLSRHLDTLGKMTLYRDVYPMFFDFTKVPIERINASSVNVLKDQGLVEDEDLIILTKGDHIGMHGGTNSMKIIRVGEV